MGRVTTEAKIEYVKDLWEAREGALEPEKVRSVSVKDALIDTGATTLALPRKLIDQLGLKKAYEKKATSSTGVTQVAVYDVARLTIGDRQSTVEVMEVPDGVPVLIGQIPLEMLDTWLTCAAGS